MFLNYLDAKLSWKFPLCIEIRELYLIGIWLIDWLRWKLWRFFLVQIPTEFLIVFQINKKLCAKKITFINVNLYIFEHKKLKQFQQN